jgi:hypothetical protein
MEGDLVNMSSILENVLAYQFEKAYMELSCLSDSEKQNLLMTKWYDESPSCVYLFMHYISIRESSNAFWHFMCFEYLSFTQPFFEDYVRVAGFHIRQALKLDPHNATFLKSLVYAYHSYPTDYFTKDEIVLYAEQLLALKADDPIAVLFLNRG